MRTQRVVFVPEWIVRGIKRNSMKLEDLLFFERIQAIFSKSELCSLVAMAGLVPQLIGNDKVQSDINCIESLWKSNLKQEQQSLLSVIDSVSEMARMLPRDETLRRIYGEQVKTPLGKAACMYESYLVGDSYIFVVVNTGHQASDYVKACSELIRDVAKKHYVYEKYHQLMSRAWGRAYIESLSR